MKYKKPAEALIYFWPTGTGKTRAVWKSILKKEGVDLRAHIKKKKLESILAKTIIVGPNAGINKIWRDELFEIVKVDSKRNQINSLSYQNTIQKNSHFNTVLKDKEYVIFDEWHRISTNTRRKLIEKSGSAEDDVSYYANNKLLENAKSVFFVSATPLRPATETEISMDEDDPDDTKYKSSLENIRTESQKMIMGLCGIRESRIVNTFKEMKELTFVAMPNKSLNLCKAVKPLNHKHKEYPNFEIESLVEDDWKLEYAQINHIYSSTKNEKLSNRQTGRSFGKEYSCTYVCHENEMEKDDCPIKYMKEKSDKYNALLKEISAIQAERYSKNILIFCIHHATQSALIKSLEDHVGTNYEVIDDSNNNLKKFNESEDQCNYILVATEKSQESINLHQRCQHIIHYELPWCPISLIQRVGRLTRIKVCKDDFKLNLANVKHLIFPRSVEEERVNRLARRITLLDEELNLCKAWGFKNPNEMIKKYMGGGTSRHLEWILNS